MVRAAGAEVGWLTWALLLTSAGMFHASVAFLPTSFAMMLLMGAWAAWMGGAGAGAGGAPEAGGGAA